MKKTIKIGELARLTEVPIETIRYYEREGLLTKPGRSEGNYRIYGPAHQERLTFIRHCRALDMALDEIRKLLRAKESPNDPCGQIDAVLDAHIEHVSERIAELQRLKAQLKNLRTQCGSPRLSKDCGILSGLSQPAVVQSARVRCGRTRGTHGR